MSDYKYSVSDIVLVNPNVLWAGKRPWVQIQQIIAFLTAILKKHNIDFTYIDANLYDYSPERLIEELRELNPRIAMMSGLSAEYFQLFEKTLEVIKEAVPECATIFGGVCPTVLTDECLDISACDYAFIGPAEYRLPEFIGLLMNNDTKAIKEFHGLGYREDGKKVITSKEGIYALPETYEFNPDFSKIDCAGYFNAPIYSHYHVTSYDKPTVTIITSFGCKFNCNFCASRSIRGGVMTYRPIEDVIEELRYFYYEHNIRHFSMLDELFLFNRERVLVFLNAILDEGLELTWKLDNASVAHLDEEIIALLKKTGCDTIFFFPESGSSRVLKDIIHKPHKKEMFAPIADLCRKYDIFTSANFIIGFPTETWDEIRETFRYAEEVNFDSVSFTIATPLPETELYRETIALNLLPDGFDFISGRFNGFGEGIYDTDEFSRTELKILRAFEWDRINFSSPEKIKKLANFFNMSVDVLNKHRRATRQNLGITYRKVDEE